MYKISRQLHTQHSPKVLYDLVNDTDQYCDFIPFCVESLVTQDMGDEKICKLVFAKGPISRTLVTRNVLTPHEQIEVFLQQGDFTHLYGKWQFTPEGDGTTVSLYFEYAFSHQLIEYTFGQFFAPLTKELVSVFCRRADDKVVY